MTGPGYTPTDEADNRVPGYHVSGWMTEDELTWLLETAKTVDSVVEIGCWFGRSTTALCASGARVIAVDHFKGSAEHQDLIREGANPRDEFHKNTDHFANLTLLDMPSGEAAKLVDTVDMVFIDGDHSRESIRNDIAWWAPKARKIVCGHDWGYDDIHQAARDYFNRDPDETLQGIWMYKL